MYERIVSCLDGSIRAERGLQTAFGLADQLDVVLEVLMVLEPRANPVWAHRYLAGLAERYLTGPEIVPQLKLGKAAHEIIASLRSHPNTLTVMTTGGHSHRDPTLGRVAQAVITGGFGPALLVGPNARTNAPMSAAPLVVPTDGSDNAAAILDTAERYARTFQMRPVTVTVTESENQIDHTDDATSAVEADTVSTVLTGLDADQAIIEVRYRDECRRHRHERSRRRRARTRRSGGHRPVGAPPCTVPGTDRQPAVGLTDLTARNSSPWRCLPRPSDVSQLSASGASARSTSRAEMIPARRPASPHEHVTNTGLDHDLAELDHGGVRLAPNETTRAHHLGCLHAVERTA